MQPQQRDGSGATIERLRIDIDSGKSGDKVPVVDPAAAPLGADEEAAGTRVPQHAVEAAHRAEVAPPLPASEAQETHASRYVWVAIVVLAVAGAVALFYGLRA